MEKKDIDKPSIEIYVNKIENRVTFKIKNGYSLELLKVKQIKIKMVKMYPILKY